MENRDVMKKLILSEISKSDSALETAYLLNKHCNQEKVKSEKQGGGTSGNKRYIKEHNFVTSK